jgi:hypothetical protein
MMTADQRDGLVEVSAEVGESLLVIGAVLRNVRMNFAEELFTAVIVGVVIAG